MEILPICRVLEILYVDVYWSYDMYILEMYELYPLRLLKIYICMLKFVFVDYVASISWIYVLFACFIALIEIGRYSLKPIGPVLFMTFSGGGRTRSCAWVLANRFV